MVWAGEPTWSLTTALSASLPFVPFASMYGDGPQRDRRGHLGDGRHLHRRGGNAAVRFIRRDRVRHGASDAACLPREGRDAIH